MSSAKRVAALNLGMQTVTMAVYEASSGSGMTLVGVERAELLPDPAADASRSGQLAIALGELRRKLKWSGGPTAVAVPSQGVFTRFVKIPNIEAEKAGQMLFFEAQQNVPFPIEEVSWCYQVLPDPEADKLAALILATKLDQLEATVGAVQSAGFATELIETSPTALYNALRYNYPELQGCTLLIDIGARATNLVFAEDDRLFIRTLPVGGNSITAAIQKKFDHRTLSEVENLKVSGAFIPLSGTGEEDGETAEMGKIARTVMTRVHNEITRSITFYRTGQQGSAPVRAMLAGGGASLPYALEFFNEKLSLPIEFFNPLRRVSVSPSADPETVGRSAHMLGECTGLAARILLSDCPLEMTLESPRLEAAKRDKKRRPLLVAAVVLLTACLAAAFLHYKTAADRVSALNAELDSETGRLEALKAKIDAASAEREKLLKDDAELVAAPLLRTGWASIIDDLGQRIPSRNIWMTALHPVSGETELRRSEHGAPWTAAPAGDAEASPAAQTGAPAVTAIAVDGLYLENEGGPAVVDAFVEALVPSGIFAIDPEKKNDVIKVRAAQSGDAWAYQYKLVLPLKRPIPL